MWEGRLLQCGGEGERAPGLGLWDPLCGLTPCRGLPGGGGAGEGALTAGVLQGICGQGRGRLPSARRACSALSAPAACRAPGVSEGTFAAAGAVPESFLKNPALVFSEEHTSAREVGLMTKSELMKTDPSHLLSVPSRALAPPF